MHHEVREERLKPLNERCLGAVSNPNPHRGRGLRGGKQEDVLKVLILCDGGLSIGDSIVPDRLIRCEEYSYFFAVNGSRSEELTSGMTIDFLKRKSVACSLSRIRGPQQDEYTN